MSGQTSKLFDVITDCHEFLSWLHDREGISIKEMPEEYKDECKQLQKLGIVYKRNNRNLGIKWQRLRKLIARRGAEVPYEREEMLSYLESPTMSAEGAAALS